MAWKAGLLRSAPKTAPSSFTLVGAALTAVRRGAGAGGMGSSGTLPLSQLSMLVGSSLSPFR